MTKKEFKDYALDNACNIDVNDDKIVRNCINGRWTRLDDSFDETSELSTVHHVCVLGIAPPEELEDLYNVYSPKYWELVNSKED